MKISFDYPEELDAEIMKEATADGHKNRSAVIRKALSFYLSRKSHKVVHKRHFASPQKNEAINV